MGVSCVPPDDEAPQRGEDDADCLLARDPALGLAGVVEQAERQDRTGASDGQWSEQGAIAIDPGVAGPGLVEERLIGGVHRLGQAARSIAGSARTASAIRRAISQ